MCGRLLELQTVPWTHRSYERCAALLQESLQLGEGGQELLVARVMTRSARLVAVPEVVRKRTVRAIDEHDAVRRKHAHQLLRECEALFLLIDLRRDRVSRRKSLIHSDVLDHARGQYDVEVRVGKRQAKRAGDDETRSRCTFSPLPFAPSRSDSRAAACQSRSGSDSSNTSK